MARIGQKVVVDVPTTATLVRVRLPGGCPDLNNRFAMQRIRQRRALQLIIEGSGKPPAGGPDNLVWGANGSGKRQESNRWRWRLAFLRSLLPVVSVAVQPPSWPA